MNLAFPAFLVFLLILPGLIFRYAYARGSWGWASPTSAHKLSDDVAFGILGSLILHAIGIFSLSGLGVKPDISILLAFLTGNFGPNDDFLAGSFDIVTSNHVRITTYFLGIYFFAAAAGNVSHRTVRRLGLDHKFKLFRFDNYWFYMLTGEVLRFRENPSGEPKPDGVYLSAVVAHGNDNYLYRGIIEDFTFDSAGRLDTIALTGAHRRGFSEDMPERDAALVEPETDSRYFDIRGDYLILRYSEIKTLNMDYFWIEETEHEDALKVQE